MGVNLDLNPDDLKKAHKGLKNKLKNNIMERKIIDVTSLNKDDMKTCREHRIMLKDFISGFIWQLLFIVLYLVIKHIKSDIIYVVIGIFGIIYLLITFFKAYRKLKYNIILYALTLSMCILLLKGIIKGKWIAICIISLMVIDWLMYCVCQEIIEKKYENKVSIKENKSAIIKNNGTDIDIIDLTRYYVIAENKNDIKVYDMELYNSKDNSLKKVIFEYFLVDGYTINHSDNIEITSIEIGDTIIASSNIDDYI